MHFFCPRILLGHGQPIQSHTNPAGARAIENTADNVWHHIVEQSQESRFGPEAIHNVNNVIEVTPKVNTALNGLYSSIRPDITGSQTMTIRQWLGTLTYDQAQNFGKRAVANVAAGVWP